MGILAGLLLLTAACAVAACLDARVRRAAWWRLLASAVGAALAPALVGALLLWAAAPTAAPEPFVRVGLAASAATGLLVGAAALGLRAAAVRTTRRRAAG